MRRLFLAAIATIALTTSALAIDFDAKIVNLDGSPIVDDKGKVVETVVGTVVVNALMTPFPDEQNLAGEEKVKRAVLAQRVQKREDYKYSAEDIALMKRLVNKAYGSPLVVTQTWDALERK